MSLTEGATSGGKSPTYFYIAALSVEQNGVTVVVTLGLVQAGKGTAPYAPVGTAVLTPNLITNKMTTAVWENY